MIRKSLITVLMLFVCMVAAAQTEFPYGSHPPAIEYKYFPNRTFAVVWRNWNLLPLGRIAKTLGCTVAEVRQIAALMGLPAAQKVPPDYRKKMYITILRRNWHLLPYEQLLTLLDMPATELKTALKEDDFLFEKLGSLKPDCKPVKYTVPTEQELERARAIKNIVAKQFKGMPAPEEPKFRFEQEFKTKSPEAPTIAPSDNDGLRFIYSYFGVYGDPLMDAAIDPYPDGLLAKLRQRGINGVWLHVVLSQLAPGGITFPEFGAGHATRITRLQKIVERAKKYGIKIYLYINEPRGMPLAFFKNHPEMEGVKEGATAAMCTSDKVVNNWIRDALTYVFKQVPGLGGVFTITASENLTNCASHYKQQNCPRCSKRSFADIIADLNATIAEGVHNGNPNAKVIVWDWGWANTAANIIPRLPKSVWFMSVSEWGIPIERGGTKTVVGEYSMSVPGPGLLAKENWALAHKNGLKTVAKVQLNNTWELSAVPWIPVPDLIARHVSGLAKEKMDGFMLSWSLGGYPSMNLEIAELFAKNPGTTIDSVLNYLAEKYYGKASVPAIRKAWTAFSAAFQHFPFDVNVLYKAPLQLGPANILFAKPTGYGATMAGFPYDDLNAWVAPYSIRVFGELMDSLVEGWEKGMLFYKEAIVQTPGNRKKQIMRDYHVAEAALLHFSSVANQVKFNDFRNRLLQNNVQPDKKTEWARKMKSILCDEIAIAKRLYVVAGSDSRIGFEASNQYYYVPQDLVEKVINCTFLIDELALSPD
ncbi:MAG: hypothetical protein J7539_15920 [Niabella sp.]|nr:hypothetical protein [Niabella sp.]